MNDQFDVTIGIPVFKSVKSISETLCSALNQTFGDIEFLIVDDFGHDGSIDVILQMCRTHPRGGNIRILSNDQNRGVSYCRNLIIDEARGRYLFFMDSDDLIEPNTIQLLYDALVHNQAQVAYGSYEIVDNVNNGPSQVYQKAKMVLNGEDELAMYAFKYNHIFHVSVCNVLIDLSFLRNTGLKFLDVEYWEDMAFTIELVTLVNKAVLLSDVTYHYIRRSGSLSHYQTRFFLEKKELQKNISVIDYLKEKCSFLKGKTYLPYLLYNLEMNSFYIVCHIFSKFHRIVPSFTNNEIRHVMWYPLHIGDIVNNRHRFVPNVLFYFLSKMPMCFFFPSIWMMGKYKKAI